VAIIPKKTMQDDQNNSAGADTARGHAVALRLLILDRS
jgi:hypothetical protein